MLDEVLYCSHTYRFIIETILHPSQVNLVLVSNSFPICVAFIYGLQAI